MVRAFYSGKLLDHPHQQPLLARSDDKGASFGPLRHIVPAPSVTEVHTYRDPYVWRTPGGWAMVVGAGTTAGNAEAWLYLSPDLEHWTPSGTLASMARRQVNELDTGEMWECPQVVVEPGGTLILIVSAWSRIGRHHQLMSLVAPTSDGMHFAAEPDIAPYDHGPNLYAVSTMNESPIGPSPRAGSRRDAIRPGALRTTGPGCSRCRAASARVAPAASKAPRPIV